MKLEKNYIQPWIIWLPAAAFAFFMVFLQSSMSVMTGPIRASFNLDSFGIGLLSASFYYTYSLLQVPVGTLVDRFGVKIVLVISIFGTFISCFIFSIAPSLSIATSARVLMGLSCASSITCAFYIGAVWFPKGWFSLIVGLTEMAAMLGGAFSTNLLAYSVKSFGWRTTVFLCGCVAVIIFITAILFVKNRRENIHDDNKAARKINIIKNLIIVLRNKDAWICGIYSGFLFSPLATIGFLWGVPFIMRVYNLQLEKAGSVIAMIFVGAVSGTPLIGYFCEKYYRARKSIMFIFTLLDLILILLLLYFPIFSSFELYFIFFLIGFFCTVYVIPFAIVKEKLPVYVCGTAMAFINVLCGCIGSLFFQPITGWILSITAEHSTETGEILPTIASYEYALSIIPICFIIAIFMIFMIKNKNVQYLK